MLRNMRETAGGRAILGTQYVGLLGSQILAATATGTNGPGAMYNDGLVSSKRYRMLLANPSAFPGVVYEDGSFMASAAVSTTYRLYEDNVLVAQSGGGFDIPFVVTIGASAARVADPTITISRGEWGLWAYRFRKQPREVRDIIIEMAPWFAGRADNPMAVQCLAPSGVSVSASLSGTRISVSIGGGIDGSIYNIPILLTTDSNPASVREFDLIALVQEVQ